MDRRTSSPSPEAKDTMRALRRAAKNALKLGLETGTPVYVFRNNQIVDLTKDQRLTRKPTATKSKTKRSSPRRTTKS